MIHVQVINILVKVMIVAHLRVTYNSNLLKVNNLLGRYVKCEPQRDIVDVRRVMSFALGHGSGVQQNFI